KVRFLKVTRKRPGHKDANESCQYPLSRGGALTFLPFVPSFSQTTTFVQIILPHI
ncbi:hypothetical protein ACJX0J_024647, partial [Zea mays]